MPNKNVVSTLPNRCVDFLNGKGPQTLLLTSLIRVGRTGLEPVTSCVSYKRASQLRQRPNVLCRLSLA